MWRDPVIWLVVIVAFLFRLIYNVALHPDGHPPSSFVIDEREYFSAAHMLVEGRGFSFFDTALWVRPPVYVLMLAAVMKVAGISTLPTLLVQSILSAFTLLPIGWLAFQAAGRRAARWATALATLYLPLTLFAGLLLSETLFVFLFAWALVALTRARSALDTGWGRTAWLWLLLSGGLLGFGVLTRATALAFVPLAALWLTVGTGKETIARRIGAAAVVVAVCVVCLVPWIARNYAAYHSFVLVDNTSGYNLWLASVGVRDEARLQNELLTVQNPADRQAYAYARAWEVISADPGAFAAKGVKESLDLWRPLFGAEERQIKGYALGRVPAWHLASLFVLDDLLYVVILLAALLGLIVSPPHPLKSLTGLWVALWVLMSFVFFAVTRFRLPVVVALIPWAGAGITALRAPSLLLEPFKRLGVVSRVASGLAVASIVLLVVPPISVQDTLLGVQRWSQQAPYRAAELLLKQNKVDAAIAEYQKANTEISDTRYGLAAALLQSGQPDAALAQLQADEPTERVEPYIIRGEAAREAGNLASARSFFNSRTMQVSAVEALDWAWDHLRPPPVAQIELGSGLDMGYVRGFYGPEKDDSGRSFRWSSDNAAIRGVQSPTGSSIIWSGWRPAGLEAATPVLEWSVDGNLEEDTVTGIKLENSLAWTTTAVPPGGSEQGYLAISTSSFISGGIDPRLLGVRISTVGASK